MIKEIELISPLSQLELLEISSFCKNHINEELDIYPKPIIFGISMDTINLVSSIASTLVAVISLLHQVYRDNQEKWTLEKLKTEVISECTRLGIPEIKITSIDNFDALLTSSKSPCEVMIVTTNKEKIKLCIFSNGNKVTIKI